MPRPRSGPRLWLDEARDTWSVIDGRKAVRTGCGKGELQKATDFLAEYIASNHTVTSGNDPLIADVLKVYTEEHLTGKPSELSVLSDMDNLADWWGARRAGEITPENCKAYIAHRKAPTICRREIGMLHAAAMYWHQKSGKGPLKTLPLVAKPAAGEARTRWLTRTEAAQFLWYGVRKLKPGQRKRLFRFFIIGWYTGTRHTAIGGIAWAMADLDSRILHRRRPGAAETRKRTPPVRIGHRLLSHLRRWKRLDGARARYVLEYGGIAVLDNGSAWRAARELAKLPDDVTPHTLRHSRATHMMRQRVNPWQAARSLGMSLAMLESTYGHHHPDWQSEAAEAK
jgi:integrase